MEKEPDIIYFSAPLCPKCAAVKKTLESLTRDNPDITFKELNIFTNLGKATKYGFLTVPALVVRGTAMKGVVSMDTLLEALGR